MSDAGLAAPVGYMSSGVQHVQIAKYGDDTGMLAEFYTEAVYQEFASKGGIVDVPQEDGRIFKKSVPGAGRPIYKDKVFIHIMRPGSKSDLRREVVMDEDGNPAPGDGSYPSFPERFPKQWQQFLNKQEQTHSGMPLEMWPVLTKAQVLELKGCKIHTIEQLGSLPDSTLQNIGILEVRVLRDKARSYMDKGQDGAALETAQNIIRQLQVDNEAMKAQFAKLAAEQEVIKRGPGRPPKDRSNDD